MQLWFRGKFIVTLRRAVGVLWLGSLGLGALLEGCALPPPHVVSAPPPQNCTLALRQAEAKAYAEGMAEGKRSQAQRDQAQAAAQTAKTGPQEPPILIAPPPTGAATDTSQASGQASGGYKSQGSATPLAEAATPF
jgi:hypothetical protein